MEVRFESMVCLWDDKIPTMFLEFMNLLTLCQSEGQLIFLSTTLLAGTVTAFCGPIGFIGLAVPHVARILFADADHRILVPASILTGIVVMLLCDVLAKLLTFPINTITALLGIPIVIWVVIRNKSIV